MKRMRPSGRANRILLITGLDLWSLGAGRGGSSFYNTLQGYAQHGYRIDVITCARWDDSGFDGVDVRSLKLNGLRRAGQLRRIGFVFRLIHWLSFQLFAVTVGLRSALESRPDAIYAYEIGGVLAARILGSLLKIPIVLRYQGTILAPMLSSASWRLRYWDHWIALRTHADLVIMADDGTRGDVVLASLGVPANCVRFWKNGVTIDRTSKNVDTPSALRKQLLIAPDALIIAMVSRLVRWKRVDRMLEVMPRVLKECPNTYLVIVGDGSEREDLETLSDKLGIAPRVRFLGAVPQAAATQVIAGCDVFVSLYDLSNVGNPLLEALALGRTVVTISNGDTGTVIEDGVNGILVEPNALYRVPVEIVTLLNDRETRLRIGQSAAEYAKTHLVSWPDRMRKEIEELEQILCKDRS